MIQIKKSLYLEYWDVNNLYGCRMSQTPAVSNSEWIEETSQINDNFIKKL